MIGPDIILECPSCDQALVTAARDSEVEFRDVMEGLRTEDWAYHECEVLECPRCEDVFRWADRPYRGLMAGLAVNPYPVAAGPPSPEAIVRAVERGLWQTEKQEWVLRLSAWLLQKPSYRSEGRVAPASARSRLYLSNLARLSDLAECGHDVWAVPVHLVPLIGCCLRLELADVVGALSYLTRYTDLQTGGRRLGVRLYTETQGAEIGRATLRAPIAFVWRAEELKEVLSLVRSASDHRPTR